VSKIRAGRSRNYDLIPGLRKRVYACPDCEDLLGPTQLRFHGRTEGQAGRAAGRGANLFEALRRHWNNRRYGASNLGFPHGKEFFRKLSANWTFALKNLFQPILGRKSLQTSVRGTELLAWAGIA